MIYFYLLEIALSDPSDTNIYAFENISHIPTSRLIEIFNINLESDPNIAQGYFLTRMSYEKHREYIETNIGPINFELFEYTLRLYGDARSDAIQRFIRNIFSINKGSHKHPGYGNPDSVRTKCYFRNGFLNS